MTRFALGSLMYALAVAAQEEPVPAEFRHCFAGADSAQARSGSPVQRNRLQEVTRAFAAARSYRACFSSISLFQGAAWGSLEFEQPDRLRWRLRQRGPREADPVSSVEAIRIGAETWLRTTGEWARLAPGRKLHEAAGGAAWLPEAAEIVKELFAGTPPHRFNVGGSARQARAGSCEVWAQVSPPAGPSFSQTVCVGAQDRLPYRINAGGPAVESYWQLEIWDYGAPVAIRPPKEK